MDSARLKNNLNEVIYEDDLPLMHEKGILDQDGFICLGCSAKAIPCSYRPENLRRPFFRIDSHMQNCDIFKYEELVKVAKKKQISTSSGFPLSYPSKLYLQNKNTTVIDKEISTTNKEMKDVTRYIQNNDKTNVNTEHHRTSSTIRPIVKHFINFPYDRNISLILPMLNTELNTYRRIFKKIDTYKIDIEKFKSDYSNLKVYYIPLSVEKNNIQVTDDIMSLKLLSGKDEKFHLIINMLNWSTRKKSEVLNELQDLTDKSREIYSQKIKEFMIKNNKNYQDISNEEKRNIKIKETINLFFVGSLDSEDQYIFKLYNNDSRLYFAELCHITYPQYK